MISQAMTGHTAKNEIETLDISYLSRRGQPGSVQGCARCSSQSGFSLIELIAVVAILGILAAVVAPRIFDQPGKARIAKAKTEISNIQSALEIYKLENFNYPTTDQGLLALVEKPTGDPEAPNWQDGGYMPRLPKDPWNRDYLFVSPGEQADVDIYTLGRDGQSGGEGEDADIGNWEL